MEFNESFLPESLHDLLAKYEREIEFSDCTPDGRVNLAMTDVTDAELDLLVCHPGFSHLDLAHTQISDAGLESVGQMLSLESLRLEGTRITSDGIRSLGSLFKLSSLHIGDSGFDWLGKRPIPPGDVPREMQIGNDALEHLESLIALQDLTLTRTHVNDDGLLRYVSNLTKLELLDLSLLDITDRGLRALRDLCFLHDLDLTNTGVKDDGVIDLLIARDESLTELGLSNTAITDRCLASVGAELKLKKLWLTDTGVTDAGMTDVARFPKLESIVLDYTEITDVGVERLTHSDNIIDLRLHKTMITDEALSYLGTTDIECLSLGCTAVTDAGMASLGQMQHLRYVSLVSTEINDEGLRELAKASSLRDLIVNDTRITNSGLAVLENLSLTSLSVNLKLNDEGLNHICEIRSLKDLRLQCESTVTSLSPFSNLHELQFLALRGFQLRDLSPLHGLTNLCWLTLSIVTLKEEAMLRAALPNCRIDIA